MNNIQSKRQRTLLPPGWDLPTHKWLKPVNFSYAPMHSDPALENFIESLTNIFVDHGHTHVPQPGTSTDFILTTAQFGEAVNWRKALMFTARRVFNLPSQPTVFTIIRASTLSFQQTIQKLTAALLKETPDPADFDYPGLSNKAYKTLYEQGKRGGPIMALARLLQSQAKCIRIILLVGDNQPEFAYIFDLAGAHPKIDATDPDHFFKDIMLRLVTSQSTSEITNHRIEPELIPNQSWKNADAPVQMIAAATALGKRSFFTEMVIIGNLINVPAISSSIASQYSEGCFATWDPDLEGLVATVTGSARPVEKDSITEEDLVILVGVRKDGSGAVVRHVAGKQNDPPSSESVEMMDMDIHLPTIHLSEGWKKQYQVPVVRSKLHGHRGVSSFDPDLIEFVPLAPAYHTYPVSCATEAQAKAIVSAFSRSEALQNPSDKRQAVFTILPGHGLMVVEKWVRGKAAFEHIISLIDSGALKISSIIPQGPFSYRPGNDGIMKIV